MGIDRGAALSDEDRGAIKVAACLYLIDVNERMGGPFIPPTAIDWLGNGIVDAVEGALRGD